MLREVESEVFVPEIKDLIFEKDGIIPNKFCDLLIKKFEDDTESQVIGGMGVGYNHIDYNIKKTTDIILLNNEKWHSDIHKFLNDYIVPIFLEYKDNLGTVGQMLLQNNMDYDSITFAKYDVGGKFEWHFDQGAGTIGRVLQIIAYLNDTESGGETDYVVFNRKIKPKKGKVVIAPCSFPFLHKSHPVKQGKKYNIISQISFY